MSNKLDKFYSLLDNLKPSDFDLYNENSNGMERLSDICEFANEINNPNKIIPVLFHFIERLSSSDLGSPGPIVHLLERWEGQYETHLADSLNRKPTLLTLWMTSRILNTEPDNFMFWVELLKPIVNNKMLSIELRSGAEEIVDSNV